MDADSHRVGLSWSSFTHVGNVRSLNEDSVLADPPVFVVADGMGGHDSGEVASGLVVSHFSTFVGLEPPAVEDIAELLHRVNQTIRAAGDMNDARSMGTTAVGLVLSRSSSGLSWLVFNVGDSRAYMSSRGEFSQLSIDHSYVQELVSAGELTEDEARHHRDRNVITRALGVAEVVHPDYWLRPVIAGERFLLCSDGLTTEVDDPEIRRLLDSAQSPDEAARLLGERALRNGGHDNVTVIVVDVVTAPVDGDMTTETRPGDAGKERQQGVDHTLASAGAVATLLIDQVPDMSPKELNEIQSIVSTSQVAEGLIEVVPFEFKTAGSESGETVEQRGFWVDDGAPPLITSVPFELDGGEEDR